MLVSSRSFPLILPPVFHPITAEKSPHFVRFRHLGIIVRGPFGASRASFLVISHPGEHCSKAFRGFQGIISTDFAPWDHCSGGHFAASRQSFPLIRTLGALRRPRFRSKGAWNHLWIYDPPNPRVSHLWVSNSPSISYGGALAPNPRGG